MNNHVIFEKLNKFCPEWIKKAPPTLDMKEMLQSTIDQVLPGLMNIKIEHIDEHKITGMAPYRRDTANVVGLMHGGTIFTLGDTLAGVFLWVRSEADQFAVTTGSEIKYLKAMKGGNLYCTVTEKVRDGRNVVLEAVFEDAEKQAISIMTMQYKLMSADYRKA